MSYESKTILKGINIAESGTLTPAELEILADGTASTKTIVQSNQTANRTITLPDATDTLVGKATTDTFTNKTIVVANNVITTAASGGLVATELNAALAELEAEITSGGGDLATHIADTTTHGTTGNIVGTSDSQTLTNKTIDADLNTLSNIDDGNIKAGAAISSLKIADGSVDNTEFQRLGAVTSAIVGISDSQTLTNKTIDADANAITNIKNADIKTGAAIDATKIADGSVDNTEFQNISGLSSPAVGTTQTQTLQNKTLDNTNILTIRDDRFTLQDSGDTSKQLQLELSGITAATTRTLTIPNANTTIVGTNVQQTLSNKVVEDDTFFVVDPAAPTKRMRFNPEGTAGTTTVIQSNSTSDTVINLPDANTTLVGRATTDTLTNKDYDGGTASNSRRLTVPKDTKANLDALTRKEATIVYGTDTDKLYVDDGTNLVQVGSGAGVINFVTNSDAETGTTGWTVDSFAAASRPSGSLTGTTTGITFSTSSSSPLAGTNSFTFAKDANNRQGRVVYTPLTFTPAYFARVMNIAVDMIVDSGTFVAGTPTTDSDFIWYIQNVTDGTFIEPSSFKILSNSTTNSFQFNGTFQTAASATSYRLLGYVASNSANSYTLKFDNVVCTPSTYAYGTPITDWQLATVNGSWVSNTTYSAYSRRIGDSKEYSIKISTSGAPTSASLTVNLPSGDVIDTTKILSAVAGGNIVNSIVSILDSGTRIYDGVAVYNSNSSISIFAKGQIATNIDLEAVTQAVPMVFTAGDTVDIKFSLPIVGLSSSVQTSDQTDTRIVAFSGGNSAGTSIPSGTFTNVPFTTVADTHGAWNGTQYVIPVAGTYSLASAISFASANWTQGRYNIIGIYKNGALYRNVTTYIQFTAAQSPTMSHIAIDAIPCVVGDTLEIRVAQNEGTRLLYAGVEENWLTITRISGPNQIAASESITASYYVSANFAATSTIPVNYDTKIDDSHNAVTVSPTAWKFTAPISGKYRFTVTNVGAAAASGWYAIFKNGSAYRRIMYTNDWSIDCRAGSADVRLLAGEYIDIRPLANLTTVGGALANGVGAIDIEKVGNY